MGKSRIVKIAPLLVLSAALLCGVSGAFAQTGSRLGSGIQPQTTIWMAPPGDIARIRSLLQGGQTEEAIEEARKFLAAVEAGPFEGSGFYRYDALNALCAALSSDGQLDEAASTCDKAVGMFPNRWVAINSRGTVHYLAGRFERAAADYRRALELQTDAGDATDILRHNLELAESRLPNS